MQISSSYVSHQSLSIFIYLLSLYLKLIYGLSSTNYNPPVALRKGFQNPHHSPLTSGIS